MELIFFNEIIALRVKTVCEKLIGFDGKEDEAAAERRQILSPTSFEDDKT